MRRGGFVVAVIALCSCPPAPEYRCVGDADCRGAGRDARCESTGWCSYADERCASERRYVEFAGNALGGACVEPDSAGTSTSGGTTGGTRGGAEGEASAETSSASSSGTDDSGGASWWDCDWRWRRPLTIELSALEARAAADAVILLVLDPTRVDYGAVRPDGADLRVVAGDGTTALPHDLDQFESGGSSLLWVRVGGLQAGSNRVFLYYGNPNPSSAGLGGVWTDYVAVWHLTDGRDASAGGYDATLVASTAIDDGPFGGAHDFEENDDDGFVVDNPELYGAFAGGATVSAWIRANDWVGTVVGTSAASNSGNGGWFFGLEDDERALRFVRDFASGRVRNTSPEQSITLGQWHHVAVAYDENSADFVPNLYIDGSEAQGVLETQAAGAATPESEYPLFIGGLLGENDGHFDGVIDEVRIRSGRLGPADIALEYRAGRDELVDYGPPEASSCPGA